MGAATSGPLLHGDGATLATGPSVGMVAQPPSAAVTARAAVPGGRTGPEPGPRLLSHGARSDPPAAAPGGCRAPRAWGRSRRADAGSRPAQAGSAMR